MSADIEPSRILVVDDEPDLELLIRQKFRKQIREGLYEFDFALNGQEALDRVKQDSRIEMILADINMPVMDGLTMLSRLAELDSNGQLKTVIVSAYGDMDNIRTAMNRGAFDFVTKPIDFQDLEITMQKTLGHVRALREAVAMRERLNGLRKELDIAKTIQQSIIPDQFPAFPSRSEFDIFARMYPAQEVGGDFFDFFLIDDDTVGVAIGDVSGKGIPGAMLMAVSRTLLKSTAMKERSPAECMALVNKSLVDDDVASMFVTLLYGILDLRTGSFVYSNAGHNLPYHISSGGDLQTIPHTGGAAIGMSGETVYQEGRIDLQPGDRLVLYTDGLVEVFDPDGRMFTDERLAAYLRNACREALPELVEGAIDVAKQFSGGNAKQDDMTVLAVEYRG
jgi:sigma-B regulation protein RsbU (phosphoserine phosphatase)